METKGTTSNHKLLLHSFVLQSGAGGSWPKEEWGGGGEGFVPLFPNQTQWCWIQQTWHVGDCFHHKHWPHTAQGPWQQEGPCSATAPHSSSAPLWAKQRCPWGTLHHQPSHTVTRPVLTSPQWKKPIGSMLELPLFLGVIYTVKQMPYVRQKFTSMLFWERCAAAQAQLTAVLCSQNRGQAPITAPHAQGSAAAQVPTSRSPMPGMESDINVQWSDKRGAE